MPQGYYRQRTVAAFPTPEILILALEDIQKAALHSFNKTMYLKNLATIQQDNYTFINQYDEAIKDALHAFSVSTNINESLKLCKYEEGFLNGL